MKSRTYPPGPKPRPVRYVYEFFRDPLKFSLEMANDYGDIVYFKLGWVAHILLNHPDYLKSVFQDHYENFVKGPAWQRGKVILGDGLLTSEGDFHRRQRRLSQPAFHRQRISEYGELMTEFTVNMIDGWRNGSTLDIYKEMYRLTLSIVAKTLFGAQIGSETGDINNALTICVKEWWRTVWIHYTPFYKYLLKLPYPGFKRYHEARDRLDSIVYRIIEERRYSGKDYGDLLSMLLLAHDDEGEGGGMTDLQLRDEIMTILLAGHETTASSLTWTWYLLSQHPEAEAKLIDELDTVLGDRIPTVDDLPELRYTRMVFAETIRLYPPVWTTTRVPLKDYEMGPYTIPANSTVWICAYAIHRNPIYFPEPSRFNPERWSEESNSQLPRFAYIPFGGGPRHCLGEQFAWMETALVIATIAQRWRLRLKDGHPVVAKPYATLRPKYGMMMQLEERKSTEQPKEFMFSA